MVQRYYVHPMAFGAVKNPGYGHIAVVKYEDYAALELQLRDAEAEIKQLHNYISDIPKSER